MQREQFLSDLEMPASRPMVVVRTASDPGALESKRPSVRPITLHGLGDVEEGFVEDRPTLIWHRDSVLSLTTTVPPETPAPPRAMADTLPAVPHPSPSPGRAVTLMDGVHDELAAQYMAEADVLSKRIAAQRLPKVVRDVTLGVGLFMDWLADRLTRLGRALCTWATSPAQS
jgi:hypothetical protein